MKYSHSIKRKKTKKIQIGNIFVGGDSPITVQTMTNTLTHDIDATLEQISLIEQACSMRDICSSVASMSCVRVFVIV